MAWQAAGVASTPIGAAILDEQGEIIALARNATRGAPTGGMPYAGSYVAHAEINAIGQIHVERRLDGCTLLTTLLPCVMCAGAAAMAHVGRVRYLAPDPVLPRIATLAEVSEIVRTQWPRYELRPADEWTVASLVLAASSKARAKPDGLVMAAHRRSEPEVAELLRVHAHNALMAEAQAHVPIEHALALIWDDIVAAATRRGRRLANLGNRAPSSERGEPP